MTDILTNSDVPPINDEDSEEDWPVEPVEPGTIHLRYGDWDPIPSGTEAPTTPKVLKAIRPSFYTYPRIPITDTPTTLARFRTAVFDVVRQTHGRERWSWRYLRRRRDLRNAFISLSVRQMQNEETLNVFGNNSSSLTAEEEKRLERLTTIVRKMDMGELEAWGGLATLKFRKLRAHMLVDVQMSQRSPNGEAHGVSEL